MRSLYFAIFFILPTLVFGQKVILDGYTYESGNRGYLSEVELNVFNELGEKLATALSDVNGHFVINIPASQSYKLVATKEMYNIVEQVISNSEFSEKLFVKLEMKRAPGYIFEITIANKREDEDVVVDAIKGADIEAYNNTTKQMVLSLDGHKEPSFQLPLLKGNHYTILIRKPGYLTKRMEAFVDVEGCILCFEGLGSVEPGVSDNLTDGNESGVLLANVELEAAFEGKSLRINNLYYELGSAEITDQAANELQKLISILKDNPHLKIELGSHTDSRGNKESNLKLSERRAEAAVRYLRTYLDRTDESIIWKGYGESVLLNDCKDGVTCSEEDHALNRRTEIVILGVDNNTKIFSLAERMQQDEAEALIESLMNQDQIKLAEGETADFLKTDDEESESKTDDKSNKEESIVENDDDEELVVDLGLSGNIDLEDAPMTSYYSIVIKFSRAQLGPDTAERQLQGVREYTTESNNYIYHVGQYAEERAAIQYLMNNIRSEYQNAYIVKFENGKLALDY